MCKRFHVPFAPAIRRSPGAAGRSSPRRGPPGRRPRTVPPAGGRLWTDGGKRWTDPGRSALRIGADPLPLGVRRPPQVVDNPAASGAGGPQSLGGVFLRSHQILCSGSAAARPAAPETEQRKAPAASSRRAPFADASRSTPSAPSLLPAPGTVCAPPNPSEAARVPVRVGRRASPPQQTRISCQPPPPTTGPRGVSCESNAASPPECPLPTTD